MLTMHMLVTCRMELCAELFCAIIPTLFPCFLLISYPYILSRFLVLLVTFIAAGVCLS